MKLGHLFAWLPVSAQRRAFILFLCLAILVMIVIQILNHPLNLSIDYLFLVAYAVAIGLGCVLVARSLERRTGFLSPAGVVLAWAQLGAGALDAVENYAHSVVAWVTAVCSKFSIVTLGLVYVGVILVAVSRASAELA